MTRPHVDAETAVAALVRPGATVFVVGDLAEPRPLVEALVKQLRTLAPLTILNQFVGGRAEFADEAYADAVRICTLLPARRLADRIGRGNVEYIPCHSSAIPRLFADGTLRADVALVQVSPPDERGRCSLGISRSFYAEVIAHTPVVIAEVNARMPRVPSDHDIPLDAFAAVVSTDRPLPEVQPAAIGPLERRLGANVAALVPDGATIEFGIGGAPEAALAALGDHRDLGVHSGLLCDAVIDLIASGVVTNARKSVDPGLTVADLLFGTRRLFDFCHENPSILFRSSGYVHDIRVMAAIERYVTINSAIEVDLQGQVNAEQVGQRRVSGIGGLLDFVRGANESPGGRPIIILPSTDRSGARSRIVPQLAPGAPVSVPAADVDWIVTEYGSASLRGKGASERARALISIAHPAFRDSLAASIER